MTNGKNKRSRIQLKQEMKSKFDSKNEIRTLLYQKSNSFCADCFDSCALYVDITNCIFICQQCAEIHKKLGFAVKSTITDDFTVDEIENLKQTNNQIFNQKWMSLYNSESKKVPFGASVSERESFLVNKYKNKKWFSTIINKSNQSFYNSCHLEIQETELEDLDSLVLFESGSSSSSSDYSINIDLSFLNYNQNQGEIIDEYAVIDNERSDDSTEIDDFDNYNDTYFENRMSKSKSVRKRSHFSSANIKLYNNSSLSNLSRRKSSISFKNQIDPIYKMEPTKSAKKSRKSSTGISSRASRSSFKKRSQRKIVLCISYSVAFDIVRHKRHQKIEKNTKKDVRPNKISKRTKSKIDDKQKDDTKSLVVKGTVLNTTSTKTQSKKVSDLDLHNKKKV